MSDKRIDRYVVYRNPKYSGIKLIENNPDERNDEGDFFSQLLEQASSGALDSNGHSLYSENPDFVWVRVDDAKKHGFICGVLDRSILDINDLNLYYVYKNSCIAFSGYANELSNCHVNNYDFAEKLTPYCIDFLNSSSVRVSQYIELDDGLDIAKLVSEGGFVTFYTKEEYERIRLEEDDELEVEYLNFGVMKDFATIYYGKNKWYSLIKLHPAYLHDSEFLSGNTDKLSRINRYFKGLKKFILVSSDDPKYPIACLVASKTSAMIIIFVPKENANNVINVNYILDIFKDLINKYPIVKKIFSNKINYNTYLYDSANSLHKRSWVISMKEGTPKIVRTKAPSREVIKL